MIAIAVDYFDSQQSAINALNDFKARYADTDCVVVDADTNEVIYDPLIIIFS